MSEAHLQDLRNALEKSHWRIVEEAPGNDYDVSAIWVIARPDGSDRLTVNFDGLDDMRTLPIEESYACHLKEVPEISLYFARVRRSWKNELSDFIKRLESLSAA